MAMLVDHVEWEDTDEILCFSKDGIITRLAHSSLEPDVDADLAKTRSYMHVEAHVATTGYTIHLADLARVHQVAWISTGINTPSIASLLPNVVMGSSDVLSTRHFVLLNKIKAALRTFTVAPPKAVASVHPQSRRRALLAMYEDATALPYPPALRLKGYIKHQRLKPTSGVFARFPGKDSKSLAEVCNKYTICIGYTGQGELLEASLNGQLIDAQSSTTFVVDGLDICQHGHHLCHQHARCHLTSSIGYGCTCETGFVGDGRSCASVSSLSTFIKEDQLDRPPSADFVLVPFMDSPYHDLAVLRHQSQSQLEETCRANPRCMGFNTNGILKSYIQPPSLWYTFTQDPQAGLYVRDLDYCTFQAEGCPDHGRCQQAGIGQYACQCDAGFSWSKPTADRIYPLCVPSTSDEMTRVVFSVDQTQLVGLYVAIRSALASIQDRSKLQIWVVSNIENLAGLLQSQGFDVSTDGRANTIGIRRYATPDWLLRFGHARASVKTHGNLSSVSNFARFLLPRLFPDYIKMIYLDVDILVQADLAELYRQPMQTSTLLAAVPRAIPLRNFLSTQISNHYRERYGQELELDAVSFNAGVLLLNLEAWRASKADTELEYWLRKNAELQLWDLGTQPPLLLLSYGRWVHLEKAWNVDGVGYRSDLSGDKLKKAKILHWTGVAKPWKPHVRGHELWEKYN